MGGLICAQQSLVVLGAEEGGSCGFASEVKEVVVHKISKGASCVWFSPLQPGLAELASPAECSQQGPERIFLLPRLGPQAQRWAPRRVGGWKQITAMQGLVAKTSKWRDRGEEERWQASPPISSCGLFPYLRGRRRAWKILPWLCSSQRVTPLEPELWYSESPNLQTKQSTSCLHLMGWSGACPRWDRPESCCTVCQPPLPRLSNELRVAGLQRRVSRWQEFGRSQRHSYQTGVCITTAAGTRREPF